MSQNLKPSGSERQRRSPRSGTAATNAQAIALIAENDGLRDGFERGWIYFVQAGQSGRIKIGWAKDPDKRLRTLQTSQALKLKMLGVVPGGLKEEKAIQRRFAAANVRGEWFERRKVLNDVMDMILEKGFLAVPTPKTGNNSRNSPEEKRPIAFSLLVSAR